MITMWYSKLFAVLLSAVVLTAGVGWCCSHNTGPNDAGQDIGGHAHHGTSTPQGLVAKTPPPSHHGTDPSHTPDEDGSGCQDELTMLWSDFGTGTVHTGSGSYFQGAPAFVLSPAQTARLALSNRVPHGFKKSPDVFCEDSLRALSCLITI